MSPARIHAMIVIVPSSPDPEPDGQRAARPGPDIVLELSRADRRWLMAFAAIVGVTVGVAVQLLWPAVHDADWLPFRDALRLVMSADVPAVCVIRPILVGAVGVCVVAWWAASQPRLRIDDHEIEVTHKNTTRVIRREQVAGVYRKAGRVVIDSTEGRRLFDEEVEGARKRAAEAFIAHGYPWEGR